MQDIDLAEAATLAAIPKSPNYYDPMDNPKANKERRDLVLDQMVKYGHITQADAQKAKAEDVKIRKEENAGKKKNTKNIDLVDKLFSEYGPKYANRNGGYTRIVKIGQRKGDAAMMVVLELV